MTPTERAQEVADLEYLIRGHQNCIQAARRDRDDPERSRREIERLDKAIAIMTRDREKLRAAVEDAPSLIGHHEQQISRIKQELFIAVNRLKLEKLLELAAEVNNAS